MQEKKYIENFAQVQPVIVHILLASAGSRQNWPKTLTPLSLDAWLRIYGDNKIISEKDFSILKLYKKLEFVQPWQHKEIRYLLQRCI